MFSGKRENLTLQQAKKKLMDLVARRDHSVKELRQKLSLRCDPETVEKTLQWAQEQHWLAPPERLQSQVSQQLARRGQGIRRINQKLKSLGLDSTVGNSDEELNRAQQLVRAKWSYENFKHLDFKEAQKLRAKIMRFLATRGYESSTISLILKNEFKQPETSEEEIYDDQ